MEGANKCEARKFSKIKWAERGMIQITPIHEGSYVYCTKLHKKYSFILTQEFPLFVTDGHCNNATLQNDIQTFEFIDDVRKTTTVYSLQFRNFE